MTRTPTRKRVASARPEQDDGTIANFTMRMSQDLADQLSTIALDEGRSRSKQIEVMLREAVRAYGRKSVA
jgi:hypothetical protein